jgi:ferrous iron transport protein B
MTLFDLNEGESGIIVKVKGRGQFRRKLMEMGFITGKKVTVIKKAPLGDPVEYLLLGYHVSIRNNEARFIEIERGDHEAEQPRAETFEEKDEPVWIRKSRNIQVALVGNPNSGKTTLFNRASGSKEKTANYAGVTVDSKEASYEQSGYTFSLVDLPGTYSLKSFSPEEIYIRNYILEKKPDIVVNVIDGSNLERNFFLTTQLIDMGIQVVIALNMYDELTKNGDWLDHRHLGELLGIPVVPLVSSRGQGVKELFDTIIGVYENREPVVRHIHINYGEEIERSVQAVQKKIKITENENFTNLLSSRYLALELLECEDEGHDTISGCVNSGEIIIVAAGESEKLKKITGESPETLITDLRFGFISGALKETFTPGEAERSQGTKAIDHYLTHKFLGMPIFIGFMWITFFATFWLGAFPKHWLENGISALSAFVASAMPAGIVKDFITDAVIAGTGGVLVFLPNIVILFMCISFMEDSGYMARAVFLMDKVMHRMGLHGKSFIPLFMGFGCNVPAIMATRIIESRRDRLITMLITPFMSCSARLPVYILFISAFFPSHHGLVLLILYLTGMLFAVISAFLLKLTFFKIPEIPFVMELPPYRIPTSRSLLRHVWHRTLQYLKKIGGVILLASAIIWFLSNFPQKVNYSRDYDSELRQTAIHYNDARGSLKDGSTAELDRLSKEQDAVTGKIIAQKESEKEEKSILGQIGHAIEPVMKPLGFDWRLSVSIISGLAAKEVVVSTMGILFQSESNDGSRSLADTLNSVKSADGKNLFSPLIAFSFMMFILIYFPCIGVIAAIKRESGGWKWAVFVAVYTTGMAWMISFLITSIGKMFIS